MTIINGMMMYCAAFSLGSSIKACAILNSPMMLAITVLTQSSHRFGCVGSRQKMPQAGNNRLRVAIISNIG